MSKFVHTPPLPPAPTVHEFTQTVTLLDGDNILGVCRWHAPADAGGVFQILDLNVTLGHRRRGHGSVLLREVYRCAATVMTPRRVWLAVRQKSQVNARAFLSRHGFHQVATMPNVLKGEELLIYARAFD